MEKQNLSYQNQTYVPEQRKQPNPRYQEVCIPKNVECMKLAARFDPQTKQPLEEYIVRFAINDETTVEEILQQWHNEFKWGIDQDKHSPDRYIIVYQLKQALTESQQNKINSSFVFLHWYTVRHIKDTIGVQNFNNIIFQVYLDIQSPIRIDQSAIKYGDYEQKYIKRIYTPFCVQLPNSKYYFYIDTCLTSQICVLVIFLNAFLKSRSNLNYDSQCTYKLTVRKDLNSEQNLRKIYKSFSDKKIYHNVNDQFIEFTKLNELRIRQVCPPGQVVNLVFDQQVKLKEKYALEESYNPTVEIKCYSRKSKDAQPNKIDCTKIITAKYADIRKIYVSTLLQQHRVQDALFTAVEFEGQMVHPVEQFRVLDDKIGWKQFMIKYLFNNKPDKIILQTVPENIIYYKTLNNAENSSKNQSLDDLVKILMKEKLTKQFTEAQRQKCVSRRSNLLVKNSKQNQQKLLSKRYLDSEFLYPIILYTSPHIYTDLNGYLKDTSIALVSSAQVLNKNWYYLFCQKFVKSLLKIKNYKGTTWRGTSTYGFDYKQGLIIEFGTFMSTSKDERMAKQFIKDKNPCFLIIKTLSGKDIDSFSYYENQRQVIIMPYTKFKVEKVSQKQKIFRKSNPLAKEYSDPVQATIVHLRQIPIPKFIPGYLTLWVDPDQKGDNFKLFYTKMQQLNRNDSELIQFNSNKQLKQWLIEFQHIISMPRLKVIYICCMNQPIKQAGIETYNTIRRFDRDANITFYVGSIEGCRKSLQNAKIPPIQYNLNIINTQKDLKALFDKEFPRK